MANLQVQSSRNARDVETSIAYLARDELFLKEKPYGADFPVDHFEGAKLTNNNFHSVPVVIRDARGRENTFTLEKNGFCFLQAKTSLTAEDASNDTTPIMAKYLEEIEKILYKSFPEYARIEIMDFQIRSVKGSKLDHYAAPLRQWTGSQETSRVPGGGRNAG